MRNLITLNACRWKNIAKRNVSSAAKAATFNDSKPKSYGRMAEWQIHSYGSNVESSELDQIIQFTKNAKIPQIKRPSEVLIKVTASSVNPIDLAMMYGYGSSILNTMRCNNNGIEFPLTLGRDFVGTIVHKGMGIKNSELKVGNKIWGVVPVHQQGCHSEYICIDKCYVSKKPEILSDIDASAILYAGLTAWSGLFITGQLGGLLGALCSQGGGRNKKVLVLGGAGGVGSMAVQILQAEGCDVVVTCSSDAVGLIQNLGITKVIDYTSPDSDSILVSESPYDIILDCAGKGTSYAGTLPWSFSSYITFSSPLLKNFDAHGLIAGSIRNAKDLITSNISAGPVKWGYFVPSQSGIQYLKKLVEHRKLLPVIDSTYAFNELPKAYQRIQNGHLRGKVVIDFTK